MFLWPNEVRHLKFVFQEPSYVAGVFTFVTRALSGDVLGALESIEGKVTVTRIWPPQL